MFIIAKLFKFSVLSTTHIRKPGARANCKLRFYGMRPNLWWCKMYSKPMGVVSCLGLVSCSQTLSHAQGLIACSISARAGAYIASNKALHVRKGLAT